MRVRRVTRASVCAALIFAVLCGVCGCAREERDPIPTGGAVTLPQGETDAFSADTTSADTSSAPDTTAEPTPEKRVTFIAAGDNVIHPGIYIDARERAAALGQGRAYDFRPMYENVREKIATADIAFINQETLMAGQGFELSGYPTFNSPQELGYDLCEVGFDVVSIANNHMADKGAAGLEATIAFWKSLSDRALMIGGYENEADYNTVRTLEKNGVRFAFLAYTYGTNGLSVYNTDAVLPYLDKATVQKQVAAAKAAADVVIVSAHWGDDNGQPVNETQKTYAKLFASLGVDVIIGHHPHLIQPIEWIEGEEGHKTLCFYSLGNFLSEMDSAKNMVGGLAGFEIVLRGGAVSVENVTFTPTVFFFNARYRDTKVFYMTEFTDADLAKHWCVCSPKGRFTPYGSYSEQITMQKLIEYTKGIIDARYLPEQLCG